MSLSMRAVRLDGSPGASLTGGGGAGWAKAAAQKRRMRDARFIEGDVSTRPGLLVGAGEAHRGTHSHRWSDNLHAVLLHHRQELRGIGHGPAGSGLIDVLKKEVNAARNGKRGEAALGASDILEGVLAPARGEDGVAGAGVDFGAVHREDKLATQDAKAFILLSMDVERWAGLRRNGGLDDGERVVRVAAGDFDDDFGP